MTNSNRIKLTWISFFSYALTGALVIVTGMVMGNIADYFHLPVSSMSNTFTFLNAGILISIFLNAWLMEIVPLKTQLRFGFILMVLAVAGLMLSHSLALKGNILGPILFLLVFNVPHILVRWCFTRWGYVLGTGVLQRIQKSGMMESLTYGASIIGLMVVGAMTASMIDITIPLSFGAGEAKTQVQDIINDILPCMLPLVSFGIVYWLLGRKVKPLSIIGGMALVGILGSWIGLF